MVKFAKSFQVLALIFLLSALLVTAIGTNAVSAQGNATITVLDAIGGTTDPTGTTTYADGTAVTLTATPANSVDTPFQFQEWDIVTSTGTIVDTNNPTTLTVQGGVDYAVQAIFQPIQSTYATNNKINMATDAIVVVLAGVGGTTTPAPGRYALTDATSLDLTATPSDGFTFSHWVIGGSPMNGHGGYSFTATPTDNPYNVNHGYGNTYTYQPVFIPTGSTIPEYSSAATIVVALALVAIAFGTYAYKRKN